MCLTIERGRLRDKARHSVGGRGAEGVLLGGGEGACWLGLLQDSLSKGVYSGKILIEWYRRLSQRLEETSFVERAA